MCNTIDWYSCRLGGKLTCKNPHKMDFPWKVIFTFPKVFLLFPILRMRNPKSAMGSLTITGPKSQILNGIHSAHCCFLQSLLVHSMQPADLFVSQDCPLASDTLQGATVSYVAATQSK